ncbi:MAG: hypothetical protein ACTHOG_04185 [Marmoricola sp.]
MTDEPEAAEPALIPPTPPTAPTPPVAPARYASTSTASSGRKRPVRTIAGVAIAVLFIGIKIALAVGAGHLLRGSSAPIAIVILVVLLLFGFVSRFMRL